MGRELRPSRGRYLFLAVVVAGAVMSGRGLLGCNDNPLITTPMCTPGGATVCTCDQDPTQDLCKGFNDRPEGGIDPADATPVEGSVVDGSVPDDAADDAADASGD